MGRIEKTAVWLDHGKTVIDILIAIGAGKAMGAVLTTFTRIPGQWVTPIWLLVSAGILWMILKWFHKTARSPQTASLEKQSAVASPQPLATVNQFYNRLDHRFSGEVETAVRTTAAQINTVDRESYYLRALTVALIYVQLETVWWSIYASQIKALQALNNVQLKRQDIFPFYVDVAKQFPASYANYSFDQWLGFMQQQTLIRYDGDLIGITIKGREFLKFLIDDAKPVNLKGL